MIQKTLKWGGHKQRLDKVKHKYDYKLEKKKKKKKMFSSIGFTRFRFKDTYVFGFFFCPFSFRLEAKIHSGQTYQQSKDSISVLNPLEASAPFLCLKHSGKLKPVLRAKAKL